MQLVEDKEINENLSSKYQEKTEKNVKYQKKPKTLQKNIMNVINQDFGYEKERTKALANLEIEKKENKENDSDINKKYDNGEFIDDIQSKIIR